jgi:hypothetical protein
MKCLVTNPNNTTENVIIKYLARKYDIIVHDRPLFDIFDTVVIDLVVAFDQSVERSLYKCIKQFQTKTALFLTKDNTDKVKYLREKLSELETVNLFTYLENYPNVMTLPCPQIEFDKEEYCGFAIVGKHEPSINLKYFDRMEPLVFGENVWPYHRYVGLPDVRFTGQVVYYPEDDNYIHPNLWNILYHAKSVVVKEPNNKWFKEKFPKLNYFKLESELQHLNYENEYRGKKIAVDWNIT